ncbi:MAG: hypothetical protein PW735_05100 [Acidobacteriaceae bacterium]|nr:hypothetical protein [Acidobacteriaceae bacterium]
MLIFFTLIILAETRFERFGYPPMITVRVTDWMSTEATSGLRIGPPTRGTPGWSEGHVGAPVSLLYVF